MEDGENLEQADKEALQAFKDELIALQKEHKRFAQLQGGLSTEDKAKWKANSERTKQVKAELEKLRYKNVFGVAKA